ncbi:hypothetical protein FSP39_007637 [Pinctada imbricata]|uniref:SAM domain-containing protein n=1 Tax=Pinctada imbricata TaxID=66713 RepID=A0AA88XXR9_PINIB|nr:hypothetical protein FSP39_007637 [Pinctada imbricata]
MKSNNMFRDQMNMVTEWFENWNECEKTVALYWLLKRVSSTQCKFIAQVLEQMDCTDLEGITEEANDPNFINKLCTESKDQAIDKVLAHLPLLRVGNKKAKTEYVGLVPQLLSYSIENGAYIEECNQLLSYSIIHPALTSDERAHFKWWYKQLEERFTSGFNGVQTQTKPPQENLTNYSSLTSEQNVQRNFESNQTSVGSGSSFTSYRDKVLQPPPGCTQVKQTGGPLGHSDSHGNQPISLCYENGLHDSINTYNPVPSAQHLPLHSTLSAPPNMGHIVPSSQPQEKPHNKLTRTPSIVPPPSTYIPASLTHVNDWLQSNSDPSLGDRGRSQSLPYDQTHGHPPLSPQSSITSSGSSSDAHQDDGPHVTNSFLEDGSGMRDVPMWLKSLRLHKYSYLFQQMSYEEMMTLSEEWLEKRNVTKGARHKIVLSIAKLKERQDLLRSLEKDIVEGGSIEEALKEMKNMLNTPIKCYCTYDGHSAVSPPPSPVSETENTIPEGDIPAQFTRLMGKICTQLLVASRPDDVCFNLYIQLIDKCINHEAFPQRLKRKIASWKQEAQRIWTPKYSIDKKPKSGWGNTFPLGAGGRLGPGIQRQMRPQKSGPQWSFGTKRLIVGGTTSGHPPLQRNSSLNPAMFSRPGLLEAQKPPVTRTHSAPLRSQHLGLNITGCDQSPSDNAENYAHMDSLCLSVTECALESCQISRATTIDSYMYIKPYQVMLIKDLLPYDRNSTMQFEFGMQISPVEEQGIFVFESI